VNAFNKMVKIYFNHILHGHGVYHGTGDFAGMKFTQDIGSVTGKVMKS